MTLCEFFIWNEAGTVLLSYPWAFSHGRNGEIEWRLLDAPGLADLPDVFVSEEPEVQRLDFCHMLAGEDDRKSRRVDDVRAGANESRLAVFRRKIVRGQGCNNWPDKVQHCPRYLISKLGVDHWCSLQRHVSQRRSGRCCALMLQALNKHNNSVYCHQTSPDGGVDGVTGSDSSDCSANFVLRRTRRYRGCGGDGNALILCIERRVRQRPTRRGRSILRELPLPVAADQRPAAVLG